MEKISLEQTKKIQVNMLEYIHNICEKNNINYFLIGGSLLGAVRHKGMIPWDDDIDIALLRNDYNKLISILKKEKSNEYMILNNQIQKDYFYPFSKLINKKTVLIENNFESIENYGVYVDIFAIDSLPEDEKEINKRYKMQKRYQNMIFLAAADNSKNKNILKRIMRDFCKKILKLYGYKNIVNKYDRICTKYNYLKNSKLAISNWPIYSKENEIQKLADYKNIMEIEFEKLYVKVPKNYDRILTTAFGNYMELPPEEKRVSNHNIEVYWR